MDAVTAVMIANTIMPIIPYITGATVVLGALLLLYINIRDLFK